MSARFFLAAGLALTAFSAFANRPWLLPSASVVDGDAAVVSVDAAQSEDLFLFDATGLPIDELIVTAPDGSRVATTARNAARRRTSFDLALPQKGTYRVLGINDSVFASWKANGEMKRWRGAPEAFAKAVPADAQDLQVTRMLGRVETFVTRDASSAVAAPVAGPGLALQPLTSPTDLSVGDSSRFVLTLDGRPLGGADVTVIRGDNRYRYKLGEIALKTGADGSFTVTWPEAGRWWLGVNHGARPAEPGQAPPPPAGKPQEPTQRESYTATFEVLPR